VKDILLGFMAVLGGFFLVKKDLNKVVDCIRG